MQMYNECVQTDATYSFKTKLTDQLVIFLTALYPGSCSLSSDKIKEINVQRSR